MRLLSSVNWADFFESVSLVHQALCEGTHVRDEVTAPVLRRFRSPHDPTPRTHVLSNGRYSVMMTAAGSGYSRWRGLDVTRWREDVTRDCWGAFVFLSDGETGKTWSAGYQPTGTEPDSYEALYSEDHVEIHRRDGAIATTLTTIVSTEDEAEMREIVLTNLGTRAREIEITSYMSETISHRPSAPRRRVSVNLPTSGAPSFRENPPRM